MKIQASAPSNIAVIKYMGKINTESNVPTNSSLSYTLNSLRTFVEITESKSGKDEWQVLTGPGLLPFEMSEKGTLRFLNHFEFLKTAWGIEGFFALKSASNFPSDCGLASSASSFAALTLATSRLGEHTGREVPDIFELASYARKGSGSSCRSLFGPWV